MLKTTLSSSLSRGYYTTEELQTLGILPPEKRLKTGPVAVIECIQQIPCDPCKFICKFHAIKKENITTPPKVDWEKCTGCGLCIGACPGLAIFTLQKKEGKGYITLPYEFLPNPQVNTSVYLLNREGKKIGVEGSHLLKEGGGSHIILRKDVATRKTALHEWLHRSLQRRRGGPTPGEDRIIESFLERHNRLFRLD